MTNFKLKDRTDAVNRLSKATIGEKIVREQALSSSIHSTFPMQRNYLPRYPTILLIGVRKNRKSCRIMTGKDIRKVEKGKCSPEL